MNVLAFETSCDDCSVAVIGGAQRISSLVVHAQTIHASYRGVVPELASREHIKHILPVYRQALSQAQIGLNDIDLIAATHCPGLSGSLIVGVCFAKALAASCNLEFLGVDHILAHFYAASLEHTIEYPTIGLVVSGGHTLLGLLTSPLELQLLGQSVDDACGEAYDKLAAHLGLGYPGGAQIDRKAQRGDCRGRPVPTGPC